MTSNDSKFKSCAVPHCYNTTIETPHKLFIDVPHEAAIRKKWLHLARQNSNEFLGKKSICYFCEDHFDLPKDMENYMKYLSDYITGEIPEIQMKADCLPSKFNCQPGRRIQTIATKRPNILKRQRKITEACPNETPNETIQFSQTDEIQALDHNNSTSETIWCPQIEAIKSLVSLIPTGDKLEPKTEPLECVNITADNKMENSLAQSLNQHAIVEQNKRTSHKYCIVPMCQNNSKTAPDKVYFYVPQGAKRQKWCEAMKKDKFSYANYLNCCEDHFNIEEDTKNYMEYKIMKLELGKKVKLRLKEGILPHIFNCQKKDELEPPPEREPMKRNRQTLVAEAMAEAALVEENLLNKTSTASIVNKDKKAKKKGTIKRQKKYEIVIEPSIPAEPNETSATSLHNQSPSHSDIPDAEPEVILPDSWLISEPVSAENDILTGQLSVEDTTIKLETEESDEILTGTDELRKDTAEDQYVPVKHEGISCDCCKGDIIGFRYTCVQCEQYNLCSACESKLTHAHHYVLRVAVPKPQSEIKDVIAAIRFKIEMLEDALTQNSTILNDCVEIKKEDPLLFEEQPNVDMQDTSDMNSNKKISTDDTLTLNTTEKDSSNIFGNITTVCSNIFENNKAERYNSNIDEVSKDMNTDENWWQETQSARRIHEKEDTALIFQNTAKRITKVDDEMRVFCY